MYFFFLKAIKYHSVGRLLIRWTDDLGRGNAMGADDAGRLPAGIMMMMIK